MHVLALFISNAQQDQENHFFPEMLGLDLQDQRAIATSHGP